MSRLLSGRSLPLLRWTLDCSRSYPRVIEASAGVEAVAVLVGHRTLKRGPDFSHQSSVRPAGSLHYSTSLTEAYTQDVKRGELKREKNQEHCVQKLDELLEQLPNYTAAVQRFNDDDAVYSSKRDQVLQQILDEEQAALRLAEQSQQPGWANRVRALWSSNAESSSNLRQRQLEEREGKIVAFVGNGPTPPIAPEGLYIYGSVGSGKTMLMDRFFRAVKETGAVPIQKRVHFNSALLEVHSLMHAYDQETRMSAGQSDTVHQAKRAKLAVRRFLRQRLKQSEGEISERLAQTNAAVFSRVAARMMGGDPDAEAVKMKAGILCFDEININDPFTAIALKGIFEALLDSGTIVVATSNRAPWELNNYGVHEAIFNRFKQRLLEACTPVCLETADFRMVDAGISVGSSYLAPLSEANEELLEELWNAKVAAEDCGEATARRIPVLFGRSLEVEKAAGGVARFTFSELCDAPRGASDYCAVAANFHTVFLSGVPIMSLQNKNLARRFILLLDELYNARTRFFCTAACPPSELFAGTADDQPVFDMDQLEQLQFESAAEGSRLRRDVMQEGGVAPLFGAGTASVTTTHLGGLEEKFAFARAVSRLHEMSRQPAIPTQ